MEKPHPRADDDSTIKVRMDNRVPLWGMVTIAGAGAVFLGGLLITIVMTQNGTNQALTRIGEDMKDIKADVRRGNDSNAAITLQQAKIESAVTSMDKRVQNLETRLDIIRNTTK